MLHADQILVKGNIVSMSRRVVIARVHRVLELPADRINSEGFCWKQLQAQTASRYCVRIPSRFTHGYSGAPHLKTNWITFLFKQRGSAS